MFPQGPTKWKCSFRWHQSAQNRWTVLAVSYNCSLKGQGLAAIPAVNYQEEKDHLRVREVIWWRCLFMGVSAPTHKPVWSSLGHRPSPRHTLQHRNSVVWQCERQHCEMFQGRALEWGNGKSRWCSILSQNNFLLTARVHMGMLWGKALLQLCLFIDQLTSNLHSQNHYSFRVPFMFNDKRKTKEYISCLMHLFLDTSPIS